MIGCYIPTFYRVPDILTTHLRKEETTIYLTYEKKWMCADCNIIRIVADVRQ